MTAEEILPLLEPLRTPPPVSWWPPAPGWWLLGALALVLAFFALRAARQRWLRRAPLRAARRELAELQAAALPPGELAARIGTLQRRLAMALAGRRRCAGLAGEAWIEFLNELAGKPLLPAQVADLAYRDAVDPAQARQLLADSQQWLRCLERRR